MSYLILGGAGLPAGSDNQILFIAGIGPAAGEWETYLTFSYSALASFKIGTSGSASFHNAKKS